MSDDMPNDRWRLLMRDDTLNLTEAEIAHGWHFCPDWDGLLVGPGMGELANCTCVYPPIDAPRDIERKKRDSQVQPAPIDDQL